MLIPFTKVYFRKTKRRKKTQKKKLPPQENPENPEPKNVSRLSRFGDLQKILPLKLKESRLLTSMNMNNNKMKRKMLIRKIVCLKIHK